MTVAGGGWPRWKAAEHTPRFDKSKTVSTPGKEIITAMR
jgi:hypothetical protein